MDVVSFDFALKVVRQYFISDDYELHLLCRARKLFDRSQTSYFKCLITFEEFKTPRVYKELKTDRDICVSVKLIKKPNTVIYGAWVASSSLPAPSATGGDAPPHEWFSGTE